MGHGLIDTTQRYHAGICVMGGTCRLRDSSGERYQPHLHHIESAATGFVPDTISVPYRELNGLSYKNGVGNTDGMV